MQKRIATEDVEKAVRKFDAERITTIRREYGKEQAEKHVADEVTRLMADRGALEQEYGFLLEED